MAGGRQPSPPPPPVHRLGDGASGFARRPTAQLVAPAERRGVHRDQAGDEHHQEDLSHERLEHRIGAGEPGRRREVAVADRGHGDVAEVREVGRAVVAGLGEERVPRDELDSVVGIGEHQADQHVDTQCSENGLRRDTGVMEDPPADGDRAGQHEERRQYHDCAVGPVASAECHPDRCDHGQRHGQSDGEQEAMRDLGRAEGQQHGEPEPDGGDDQGDSPAPSHGEEHVVDEEEQEHDPVGVRSEDDVAQRCRRVRWSGSGDSRSGGNDALAIGPSWPTGAAR